MSATANAEPILVKRYANSRLYDASNGRYVSIEQLRGWAAEGVTFDVIDQESGADIRRVLLA
jgi:polyhydroxyalkanoate synthesis regulator protein